MQRSFYFPCILIFPVHILNVKTERVNLGIKVRVCPFSVCSPHVVYSSTVQTFPSPPLDRGTGEGFTNFDPYASTYLFRDKIYFYRF